MESCAGDGEHAPSVQWPLTSPVGEPTCRDPGIPDISQGRNTVSWPKFMIQYCCGDSRLSPWPRRRSCDETIATGSSPAPARLHPQRSLHPIPPYRATVTVATHVSGKRQASRASRSRVCAQRCPPQSTPRFPLPQPARSVKIVGVASFPSWSVAGDRATAPASPSRGDHAKVGCKRP